MKFEDIINKKDQAKVVAARVGMMTRVREQRRELEWLIQTWTINMNAITKGLR